ncbi:MAG: hypothetical protein ACXQS2_04085 [Methermicoccaceae archaeon]
MADEILRANTPGDVVDAMRTSRKATLSHISPTFYSEVAELIESMEKRQSELAGSSEAEMLEDQLVTVRRALEHLFRNRLFAVCKYALMDAISGELKTTPEMIPFERKIYEGVFNLISEARYNVLDPLLGRVATDTQEQDGASRPLTAGAMALDTLEGDDVTNQSQETPSVQGESVVEGEVSKNTINKYVVVRVLKDVPAFLGVNGRTYALRAEDIVSLPELNAIALNKRGAVAFIDCCISINRKR